MALQIARLIRLVALSVALAMGALAATAPGAPARASADIEAILSGFAADQFPRTIASVQALAASGHPQAEAILEALADGRLVTRRAGGGVLFVDRAGAHFDAATGEPVAEPGATARVRVNNGVRRAIDAALGSLTLMSPDPRRRLDAAQAALRSLDIEKREALAEARAAETDARVARAQEVAMDALALFDPREDAASRIAAIERIAGRANAEARTILSRLPADAPDEVREAARDGLATIERRLAVVAQVQNVFFGLSLGSVLLLAAIGLAVTFGVMGVINMAHGEMVMIGAYATFVVQQAIRTFAPGLLDASLLIALPVAFLTAGLVGIAIERLVIRHLYGRPLETLLATWGVSLVLQQAVRSIFGPTNREVVNPSFMSGSVEVMGIALTWSRVWIVAFALVVFLALLLAMKLTPFGLRMRAVVQNRRMAASMGIRTPAIDALTFGLGSGIAGIAGVALSQIDNVSPNLGQSYIIDSFLVVVFGGVGSLWGAFVAAFSLGVANKLIEPMAGAVLAKILVLVAIILFIQKRPRGLFALKGRAVGS